MIFLIYVVCISVLVSVAVQIVISVLKVKKLYAEKKLFKNNIAKGEPKA